MNNKQIQPHVLVTRPVGQQQLFIRACHGLGFRTSHLPTVAILARDSHYLTPALIQSVDRVLFTSRNAVIHAAAMCPLPWSGPLVHAIGPATANALTTRAQAVTTVVETAVSSEAMLEALSQMPACRLLIVKGAGGRDLLATQLPERGWHVEVAEVYERSLAVIPEEKVNTLFVDDVPDIVCISSDEVLKNLLTICHAHIPVLLSLPLIVNSERCRKLAEQSGFHSDIHVAEPPGDSGQLKQLKDWASGRA